MAAVINSTTKRIDRETALRLFFLTYVQNCFEASLTIMALFKNHLSQPCAEI